MNRTILALLFSLSSWVANSQKIYFVYLQTENEQAFFVKMNEKVHSSSASGYLILSRLKDSSYNFSIGFPQDKWPEQHFTVTVNKKDQGFLVKNFGEKGWGLFDLQTLSVQMSGTDKTKGEKAAANNKDVSHFTDILAKAANDPSLREKPIVVKTEEKKTEPTLAVVKKEEPLKEAVQPAVSKTVDANTEPIAKKEQPKSESSKTTDPKQTDASHTPLKKENSRVEDDKKSAVTTIDTDPGKNLKKEETRVEEKKSSISRNDSSSTVQKQEINKVDEKTLPVNTSSQTKTGSDVKKEESKVEAIKTDPPIDKKDSDAEKKEEVKMDPGTKTETDYKPSVVTKRSESSTTEGFGLVFIDAYENGTKDTVRITIPHPKPLVNAIKEEPREEKKFLDISSDTTSRTESKPAQADKNTNKNKCTDLAVDDDFFKLRKRMAGMTNDESMINEAKKAFKSKCFSVDQIKKLSAMFWNEQGKYQFFDAAYLHISDAENFSTLQAELKDPYYINRFKAMLRN